MARNIEIKARVPDLAVVRSVVVRLAAAPGAVVQQMDTFFVVPRGRLKVREFADGSGELIAYERPDASGPQQSIYSLVRCPDARALVRTLAAVLTVRGQVRKRREVFIVGRTRVHLDEVDRLGSFVELEVVLRDDDRAETGEREARELMETLSLSPSALVSGAYIDLLERLAG